LSKKIPKTKIYYGVNTWSVMNKCKLGHSRMGLVQ